MSRRLVVAVCADCGRERQIKARDRCDTCYFRQRRVEHTATCGSCGRLRPIRSFGLCLTCYSQQRIDATKRICPDCSRLGLIRAETGLCGWCTRRIRLRREPQPIRCRACGQWRLHQAQGLCDACYKLDPERLTRSAQRIADQLEHPPPWLLGYATWLAAATRADLGVAILSQLAPLLATGPVTPQRLLERARRPGRSPGRLARTLEDFFVAHGLAVGLDLETERAEQRRQRRLEATPEPYRTLAVEFASNLVSAQHRARRAGTRPLTNRTIDQHLTAVRNLAHFLADQRPQLAGWEQVTRTDVDAYLATVRAARSYLGGLMAFFSWARQGRRILADPTRGLRRQNSTGYQGRLLTAADQRQLLLRWTTKACHPNEAAIGMLALLHAASVSELRHLTVDDLDHAARSIRLGRRPHPLPLDPLTWESLADVLSHRTHVGATNPHLFVTIQTTRRQQPMSTTYLHTLLGPLGIGARQLRSTRLTALAVELDPRLVSAVVGMADVRNALRYRPDHADEASLAPRR